MNEERFKIVVCGFSQLPPEVDRNDLSENGVGSEGASYLLVYLDGKLLRCESSAMEPEDISFYRDLRWVSPAIVEAWEAALALRDQWIYSVGHGDDCECGLSVKSLHRTLEEAEIKAQKLLAENAWHTDEHRWIEVPWNADDPNTLKLWKLGTTHDIVGIIRWPLAARQVPVGPEGKK